MSARESASNATPISLLFVLLVACSPNGAGSSDAGADASRGEGGAKAACVGNPSLACPDQSPTPDAGPSTCSTPFGGFDNAGGFPIGCHITSGTGAELADGGCLELGNTCLLTDAGAQWVDTVTRSK
jgi:hypothetical protein